MEENYFTKYKSQRIKTDTIELALQSETELNEKKDTLSRFSETPSSFPLEFNSYETTISEDLPTIEKETKKIIQKLSPDSANENIQKTNSDIEKPISSYFSNLKENLKFLIQNENIYPLKKTLEDYLKEHMRPPDLKNDFENEFN